MSISSFDYIMFVIVMAMSCDIVSDIAFMFYFLCKILVISNIQQINSFTYIVCLISVCGIMLISNNIISKIKTRVVYIMCFIYLLVIKHIS